MSGPATWPVVAGTYQVGDPQAPVAVCALTSEQLIAPLATLPGVAIAGKVYTANLGIARMLANLTANPAIRFLLLCGKDSPLFRPGQSLAALAEAGADDHGQIVGAAGYEPVLPEFALVLVPRFRRQVELVDWSGEEDLATLEQGIARLAARSPGPFAAADGLADGQAEIAPYAERFTPIRPGGQREPLQYDPKGYFVITLDRAAEEIILRHYLPDHSPAHEMRGHSAGPMLLGLLREGLVTQLSHAGYLGEELAKAEAALRFGLRYDQDRPLRRSETASADTTSARGGEPPAQPGAAGEGTAPAGTAAPVAPGAPGAPATRPSSVSPPLTWAQLQAVAPGSQVDIALAVDEMPAPDLLAGAVLDADEAELFSAYHRTSHQIHVRWSSATTFAMGGPSDLRAGALLRARGTLAEGPLVVAERLVIITRVARIVAQ